MAKLESPILENLKRFLGPLFGKSRPGRADAQSLFRFKYVNFQELLESNAELLRVIASMEEKLPGRDVFGMAFLHAAASQGVFHCLRMVRGFENLSGTPQPVLRERIEAVREEIKAVLSVAALGEGPWFKDFSEISLADDDLVGGKCSRLGESRNRAGLPVPEGFAITTAAFRAFLSESDLTSEIAKRTMSLDPSDAASIQEASEDIQRLLLLAPFPDGFEEELARRHDGLAARLGQAPQDIKVAMRSSALGEDGDLSFAGQYLSVLGVARPKLSESYRYVAASLYTPRAMAYRLQKGVPDEAAAMGVACLAMVPSRASGVMYTRHPFDPDDENILINAVWGLGPYAVDGVVTPDRYVAAKPGLEILAQDVARKPVQLSCNPGGGVVRREVEAFEAAKPCLTPAQIRELAAWGLRLEAHYGGPQDVEWALDQDDRLILLQSRPLAPPPQAAQAEQGRRASAPAPGRRVLLEGGETASPGAGCGEVFHVRRDDDLADFPDGAVLVAAHSSPKFMVVMPRARAIVTDHGSVTGHMASLTREFGVPAVLGLEGASGTLKQGELVTVDAGNRRIYQGRVEEVLTACEEPRAPMLGTPVHNLLRAVNALVGPLNLIDPKAPEFSPRHCRTLHDITRYLHEKSYAAMFTLGDQASGEAGMAVRLEACVGLDLHVIDLGGGLNGGLSEGRACTGTACLEQVASRPLKALMRGLADEAFVAKGPKPVHLRGFLSVMGRQMVDGASMSAERFGDKSYAIVSDKYLNFSSRVGYHYGVLDSYCGHTVSKNYITFAFKGGAAGEDRRERRARAIALILERLGFTVGVSADRVEGRFQKYPAELIEERLVQLGRLLQYTRQTDMLMTSEEAVAAMAESFLRGETVFGVE
jgi:pyruvate,water dikinase